MNSVSEENNLLALNDLIDVEALPAAGGAVLVWNETDEEWQAGDHSNLAGLGADDHPQYFNRPRGDARYARRNHTHAINDLSDVTAPSPSNGQVLLWRGTQWVPSNLPTSGGGGLTEEEVVLSPNEMLYGIVAAGVFDEIQNPSGIVYNDLQFLGSDGLNHLFTFNNYQNPIQFGNYSYVVKGTPIADEEQLNLAVVFQFVRFDEEGFWIRLVDIRGNIIEGFTGRLMLEVSAYGEFPR